jgi:1-acyl-sn-glycerol-3-phosphate acyltransferase
VRDFLLEVRRVVSSVAGWLFFVLLTLLWGVLAVPLTLLLRPLWPGVGELFAALTGAGLRVFVRTLPFARIRLEGTEKRLEGPRILVVNHASRLDSPVLLAFEPRLAGPVRGYMLRVPLIGSIIRLLGFFDVDAGSATINAMYRAAEHARKRDGGLLFYPEGTRSRDGEIGHFHRGAFQLAVDAGLPIQPVVLEGLDVVYPAGRIISPLRGRRQLVRIRYLEPLRPPYGNGPRREVSRGLAERVRETLVEELERMRAERASG